MPVPLAIYPANSTFGHRINHLQADKQVVAQAVVDRFLGPGQAAFISDGSSTFYVALELYDQARLAAQAQQGQRQHAIRTNHLAVALELALWDQPFGTIPGVSVAMPAGKVKSDLMMVSGDRAEAQVKEWVQRSPYTVLSVRSLFGAQGPAGMEDFSLRVKQIAIDDARANGKNVIIIADHEKLSNAPDKPNLVFQDARQWQAAMEYPYLYVVTTKPPGFNPQQRPIRQLPNPPQPVDLYIWNSQALLAHMGDRFIEV